MSAIRSDQQRFDAEVAHRGKLILQVLAGLGVFAALLMSIIAVTNRSETRTEVLRAAAAPSSASAGGAAGGAGSSVQGGSAGAPAPGNGGAGGASAALAGGAAGTKGAVSETVSLKVIPEGKKGPEGKLHDDFTVTEFHVIVGKPLTLKIDNTDTVPHSITAPEAGVNIIVQPGTHEYKLTVDKPGTYEWHCIFPCDPWSMEHVGYMRGYITATAA
jgi:plastocyanin